MSGPVPLTARPVQLRGSRLAHAVLKGAGWQLDFQGLPARQGVLVVYPHTSNWDFPLGLLAKWAAGIPVTFWGKDSAFRFPLFGAWLRWLGGVPVDARRVGVDTFLQPCGDAEADMADIARRLAGCRGYRPNLASPIRLP